MGVEPFLVASSLTRVVAQRLVRRPCAACAVPDRAGPGAAARPRRRPAELLESATPRRGTGCAECGGTGYRGRTGVFEVLVVDQELRRVLVANPTEHAIAEAVRDMPTLRTRRWPRPSRARPPSTRSLRVSPQE